MCNSQNYCIGMTITGLVALVLGDSEQEHGLTFVGLSRATDIQNVFLGPGLWFERRARTEDEDGEDGGGGNGRRRERAGTIRITYSLQLKR